MFRSLDSGQTWSRSFDGATPGDYNTWDFAVSPGFASDQTVFVVGNNKIHKSVDAGQTWIPVGDSLPEGSHFSLAISPVYAADQTIFDGTYNYGLYRSTDGGGSWTGINSGLPTSPGYPGPSVSDLVISPDFADDQTIFANIAYQGVFRSIDGGTTWMNVHGPVGSYMQSLAISPNYAADQTVFADGHNGIVMTQDGGTTWTQLPTTGLSAGAMTLIVTVSPQFASDGRIFIGTGDGVWTTVVNRVALESNVATVTITVNPVNDEPSFDITALHTVLEDADAQSVANFATNISAGPSNESSQTLTFNITDNTNPVLLSAGPVIASNGTLSYTPAADANGTATITVELTDNGGTANGGDDTSAAKTFDIVVNSVNDEPLAVDDNYTTDEDTPLTISAPGVLANDSDAHGGAPSENNVPLTVTLIDGPDHATSFTLHSDGSFDYTPVADYNGSDIFTYETVDSLGAVSNTAEVPLTIAPVNDAPVATNDAFEIYGDVLNVPADGVLGNDSDIEDDPLAAQLVDLPGKGTVALDPDGSFEYTPGPSFDGIDSFTYQAHDGTEPGNVAAVTITHMLYVRNTNDSGDGSFRWTIDNANTHPSDLVPDVIRFAIGTSPQMIQPTSPLPEITDPVFIDGATQPGFAGTPIVELNGSLTTGGDGLLISAGNSTIRGLVVNRFHRNGIQIAGSGASGNVLIGNYIGLNAAGTAASGNAVNGVLITNGASNNRIGTDGDGVNDAEERNIISGNNKVGVQIQGAGANYNIIAGNYIGMDLTGTTDVPNRKNGIDIRDGASYNLVGTDGSNDPFNVNERNIISGNGYAGMNPNLGGMGVHIFRNVTGNAVAGNYVGTDVTGTVGFPNHGDYGGVAASTNATDIRVGTNGDGIADEVEGNLIAANVGPGVNYWNASNGRIAGNLIGVDANGNALGNGHAGVWLGGGTTTSRVGTNSDGLSDVLEGNAIAFNALAGVMLPDSAGGSNSIRGNSIHSNGGLGIDLGDSGITPNDPGDADTGPNNLQNFPMLSVAEPGAATHVVGTLNSQADTTFILDFYANTTADPSGYGEGQRFLGLLAVLTDSAGDASFDLTLPAATTYGEMITATATASDSSTSEFSAAQLANSLPTVTVDNTGVTVDEGLPALNAGTFADVDPGTVVTITASTGTVEQVGSQAGTWNWSFDTIDGPDESQTVTITATDSDGAETSTTFELVVNNLAPVVTAAGDQTADEGALTTFSLGSFTDPGDDDPWQVTVASGDSTTDDTFTVSSTGDLGTLAHTYADDGLYTVTVTLQEDNGTGASGADAFQVIVANVAPYFEAGSNETIWPDVLGHFEREIDFTDPGTLDEHTVKVDWDGDAVVDETFTVPVGDRSFVIDNTYTQAGMYTVNVTVEDDDGGSHSDSFDVTVILAEVEFTAATYSDHEGAGTSTVVTLERSSDTVMSEVLVTITGGTALGAGVDYDSSSFPLTVTFDVGESTKAVPVPIVQENLVELDETITFEVTAISNATIADQKTAELTVTNDDNASVSIGNASATEADDLEFTVTLSNPVDVDTIISYSTADGTATTSDSDYTAQSNETITIDAGEMTGTITVATTADNVVEADENLTVLIESVNAEGRAVWDPESGGHLVLELLGDGNTLDTSGQGNDATIVGTVLYVPGHDGTGQAFAMNDVGYLRVDNHQNLPSGADPRSLTMWVHTNAQSWAGDANTIFHTGAVGQFMRSFAVDMSTYPDLEFYSWANDLVVNTGAPLEGWIHVAATYDGSDLSVWIDGNPKGSKTLGAINTPAADPVYVGYAPISAQFIFNSYIDDVRFYDDALTEEQLQQLVTHGDVAATGTITNDDSATITVANVSQAESDTGTTFTFNVTLSNDVQGGLTVAIDTGDGSATTADNDYVANTGGLLTFDGTLGEIEPFQVTVTGDTKVEVDETFDVLLGALSNIDPTAADDIITIDGTGTIENDDSAALTISTPSITETDVNQTVRFTVTLDAAVQGGFNVAHSLTLGSAEGTDLTVVTASPINFAGDADETRYIDVTVMGDDIVEDNETFTITLGDVTGTTVEQNGDINTGDSAEGTINNDDSATLTISAPSITETDADQTLRFTVALDAEVEEGFDVAHGLALGSAEATDLTVVTASPISFVGNAGETQDIDVTIVGDDIVEDNETFTITLGDVTGATVEQDGDISTGDSAEGTINNDDSATLTISAPSITETDADQTVRFTVTLDAEVEDGFDVAHALTLGSAEATDLTVVTPSPLTFTGAAGEKQYIGVTIVGEDLAEGDEMFTITLGDVTSTSAEQDNSITTADSAVGTIVNDDYVPVPHPGGPYVIDEGDELTLDASLTTDTDTDPITLIYRWDVDGDGDYDENVAGINPTLTLTQLLDLGLADGPHGNTVTVLASDRTNSTTASTTLTINNVAPVITNLTSGAEECGNAHEDDPITLRLDFTDPGWPDVHTVAIDWGDGNVTEPPHIVFPTGDRLLEIDHTYVDGGIYTITVTLSDDDGGVAEATVQAVISGVGLHVVDGENVLQILGTPAGDHVMLNQTGSGTLKVHADFIDEYLRGETRDFNLADIDRIFAFMCSGDDHVNVSSKITLETLIHGSAGNDHLNGGGGSNILLGGSGNDHLNGGSARDILIGGDGADRIVGNPGEDILIGGRLGDEVDLLEVLDLLDRWNGPASFADRVADMQNDIDSIFADDEEEDTLTGASGEDWFVTGLGDVVTDGGSKSGKGGKKK